MRLGPDFDAYLDQLSRAEVPVADVLAAVAREVARRRGFPAWSQLRLSRFDSARTFPPPPASAGQGWLGPLYEGLLDPDVRRGRGAHFTPRQVATGLTRVAVSGFGSTATMLDPAVGGGAFLLAAAELLTERGGGAAEVVAGQLWGVDVDPLAVAVAEAALALWAWESGVVAIADDHLRVGDALGASPAFDGRRFDVVVGNPPFRSQLASATARSTDRAATVANRFGEAARGYVDDAGLFVLAALDHCRPDGRIALIQPVSILSAAAASGIRETISRSASLVGIWSAPDVFEASVDVCALVIEPGGQHRGVQRYEGPGVTAASVRRDPDPDQWAALLAGDGIPEVELRPGPVLGDIATATAGFRDQHYGLAPHVLDDPADSMADLPRLVNVGLIEPLHCEWGERPVRFAKRRWQRPRLDLDGLRAVDGRLAAWVDDRLQPKVVVATQTRVVEAAVDHLGCWVPSTPAISVHAPVAELGRVAALLLAPPLSAWARRAYGGAGLSADAIKLAAKQLLDLPLPPDRARWAEAAALVEPRSQESPRDRHHRLVRVGRLMTQAYGEPERVFEWWRARLRAPRSGTGSDSGSSAPGGLTSTAR